MARFRLNDGGERQGRAPHLLTTLFTKTLPHKSKGGSVEICDKKKKWALGVTAKEDKRNNQANGRSRRPKRRKSGLGKGESGGGAALVEYLLSLSSHF